MNLRDEIFKFEDIEYKNFSSKLTNTKYPIIGVRIPDLKRIAKKIKNQEISFDDSLFFEEIMVEGLYIGYLENIDIVIKKLSLFIDKIDDWSVCDSSCANLKITRSNKMRMWEFITSYKNSNKEFEVRFMIVMMMDYYLEHNYIDEIFDIIDNINCDFYYSNMAISWLLATALVKCPKETLNYLNNNKLGDFVFNKAISKACESYRIDKFLKEKLKKMKR